jgi:uncharacterized repeat protein (TIGR03803 family)
MPQRECRARIARPELLNKREDVMSNQSRNRLVVLLAAAALVPTLIAPQTAHSQTFSVLYTFQGGPNDGASPAGKLILDASGNLYGLTEYGGARTLGWGTIFKIDATTGKETVLYSFTGGADGGYAYGGLVQDAAGNLYGTTSEGGNGSCGGDGCGVVFEFTTAGKETVLYQFTGGSDGGSPNGDLVRDKAGNLYGTAYWGPYGYGGVAFKVNKKGNETVLHQFTGFPDGEFPVGGLIRDKKGNLFGTTSEGGGGACLFEGCGTVFQLSKTGKETILYRFLASPDGAFPYAGLLQGTSGDFYGTTYNGGDPSCNDLGPGCGTIFKVDVSGREKILYRFRGKKKEELPVGGLIADAAGNLYGTTAGDLEFGHATSFGTVFKLDTQGNETLLYRFTGGADGCRPIGNLTFDSAGNLYGVASSCGANSDGTVFKIAP